MGIFLLTVTTHLTTFKYGFQDQVEFYVQLLVFLQNFIPTVNTTISKCLSSDDFDGDP